MPVRTLALRPDHRPREEPDADWAALLAESGTIVWVDAEAPTVAERAAVGQAFGLDPRALDLARRTGRRAIVRAYRGHFLVTVLAIHVQEARTTPRVDVVEVDLLVGRDFLITLHDRSLPFREELEERIVTNPYLGRFDAPYLLYVLLDTMVGHYARQFDEVEDEVELLEERMLAEPGTRWLDRATVMKRHILTLRRLLAPHREAFGILVAAEIPQILEAEEEPHFRDLLLHLDTFLERLDHARDVVTGTYDLYISAISHRTNTQLRVLTFLSAVFLPMTLVTGIFGTNFALGEYQDWQPFYVMLGGMAAMAVGMLAFFRWRRWV